MRLDTKKRAGAAPLVNTAMVGTGLFAVLMVSAFREHAASGTAAAVLANLILAVSVAWLLAPRQRARTWGQQPRVRPAYAYVRRRR